MSNDQFSFLPDWLQGDKKQRVQQALADLDDVVYGMIREWRAHGEDRGDLLSMLLLAEDEDGERMSDKQARDESVTLILAGHETTANALNWTFYLLAKHPDIAARLHEELDTVLGGAVPKLEDIKRLPYTELVIKESMRLYPPAYSFGRVAIEDVTIGETVIEKGTVVGMFTYVTHRDPRFWDDPEAFKPERFTEELAHKYAYLPFGGGPRVCIGNSFAMMEAMLLLATIASRYELSLAPGYENVQTQPLITLRPKGGLQMRLRARKQIPVMA